MNEIEYFDEISNGLERIKQFPEEFGFEVTEKLSAIKAQAMEILRQFSGGESMAQEVIDIMTEYQIAGQEIIDTRFEQHVAEGMPKDKRNDIRLKAMFGHQIDRIILLLESNFHKQNKEFVKDVIYEAAQDANGERWDKIRDLLLELKNSL